MTQYPEPQKATITPAADTPSSPKELECFESFDTGDEPPYNEFDDVTEENQDENWYPSYVYWNGCLTHHETQ